jgi:hypothetical protein
MATATRFPQAQHGGDPQRGGGHKLDLQFRGNIRQEHFLKLLLVKAVGMGAAGRTFATAKLIPSLDRMAGSASYSRLMEHSK